MHIPLGPALGTMRLLFTLYSNTHLLFFERLVRRPGSVVPTVWLMIYYMQMKEHRFPFWPGIQGRTGMICRQI